MIVLGLTGSIGMGKSTAAKMLRMMGLGIHDSDEAVHRALLPDGRACKDVVQVFPGVQDSITGIIDRKKLGAIVFHDKEKMKQLEAILHPAAKESQKRFIADLQAKGHKAAILEIPLLFETGAQERVDYVICVTSPPDVQKQRVMKRPGMTEEKFQAILAAQMPDEQKKEKSDFIVDTGHGYIRTFLQLRRILKKLGVL